MKEAAALYGRALELVEAMPEGAPRDGKELVLQVALGRALIAARGEAASETGRAYARARHLLPAGGDSPHALPALYGRYIHRFGRGELRRANELAREYLDRARRGGDAPAEAAGHRMLGATSLHLGRLTAALKHLERALAMSDAAPHRAPDLLYPYDSRVMSLTRLNDALFLLGYPDQALARCRQAIAEAEALAQPETLGTALACSIGLHQDLRDVMTVEAQARALVGLGTERDIPYFRFEGALALGWVLAERGRPLDGLEAMRHDLVEMRANGQGIGMTNRLLTVASVCGKAGRFAEGLNLLAEAFALARRTGERWFEAELRRLEGELQSSVDPDQATTERCFLRAMAIARAQRAKLWELRAVTNLARAWSKRGRPSEARDLLAPVYSWFTEGFDTPDLIDAKTLLDTLA